MTLPALYELAREYRADAEKLADMDLDETTLADTLEGMSGALEMKAQNTAIVARNMEATADAIKQAEAAMSARRKAIEHRAARLREYIKSCMEIAGVSKIECPLFAISIKNNPPAVEVFEQGLIPSEYMHQPEPPPPAPDKKAIAETLKKGTDVPGCRLTKSTRLEVR